MNAKMELENVIHDALYPCDRDDRMTWPPGIFKAADAILAAGYVKADKKADDD